MALTPKRMRTTSLPHNDLIANSICVDQQQQHQPHYDDVVVIATGAAGRTHMESPQWSGGGSGTTAQRQQQQHYYSGLNDQQQSQLPHVVRQAQSDNHPAALQQQLSYHQTRTTIDKNPQQQPTAISTANTNTTEVQQQQQHQHWLADAVATLSPASSCGSPEFQNHHHQNHQHHQQNHTGNGSNSNGTINQSPFQQSRTASISAMAQAVAGTPGNNGADSQQHHQASNNSTTSSTTMNSGGSSHNENSRRGRPRSEALSTLMIEGSTSPSAIKCGYCHRVFPREKSLQAHLRTHTGKSKSNRVHSFYKYSLNRLNM